MPKNMATTEDALWCMASLGPRVGDQAAFMITRAGAAATAAPPPESTPPPQVLNLGPGRSRFWEAVGIELSNVLDHQVKIGIMSYGEASDVANDLSEFLIGQSIKCQQSLQPLASPKTRDGRPGPA